MVKALSKLRRVDVLLPSSDLQQARAILSEYWRRYHLQCPNFELFDLEFTPEDYTLLIPIKLHGDEGRSALVAHVL